MTCPTRTAEAPAARLEEDRPDAGSAARARSRGVGPTPRAARSPSTSTTRRSSAGTPDRRWHADLWRYPSLCRRNRCTTRLPGPVSPGARRSDTPQGFTITYPMRYTPAAEVRRSSLWNRTPKRPDSMQAKPPRWLTPTSRRRARASTRSPHRGVPAPLLVQPAADRPDRRDQRDGHGLVRLRARLPRRRLGRPGARHGRVLLGRLAVPRRRLAGGRAAASPG